MDYKYEVLGKVLLLHLALHTGHDSSDRTALHFQQVQEFADSEKRGITIKFFSLSRIFHISSLLTETFNIRTILISGLLLDLFVKVFLFCFYFVCVCVYVLGDFLIWFWLVGWFWFGFIFVLVWFFFCMNVK